MRCRDVVAPCLPTPVGGPCGEPLILCCSRSIAADAAVYAAVGSRAAVTAAAGDVDVRRRLGDLVAWSELAGEPPRPAVQNGEISKPGGSSW